MAYTQARNRATQKYVKANYERLYVTVKKGEKDKIKAMAAGAGESVNEYITTAIRERMERKKNKRLE